MSNFEFIDNLAEKTLRDRFYGDVAKAVDFVAEVESNLASMAEHSPKVYEGTELVSGSNEGQTNTGSEMDEAARRADQLLKEAALPIDIEAAHRNRQHHLFVAESRRLVDEARIQSDAGRDGEPTGIAA